MLIKKISPAFLFTIALIVCSCIYTKSLAQQQNQKTIQVITNKSIELFGLMVQLDNGQGLESNNDSTLIENKKTAWKDWYALTLLNYERYKAFENDTIMKFYRQLSQSGIPDDFIYGFLIQCDDLPNARINSFTDKGVIEGFSKNGDSAEGMHTATTFLQLLNRFNKEIDFESYLKENSNNYVTIVSDVRKNVPSDLIAVMEGFYQKHFNHYYLVPSLNMFPTTGFGKMRASTNTVYNILGALGLQSFKTTPPNLAFDYADRLLGLTVHEFGHSFVNPAIDKVPGDIIEKTNYLYEPIKDAMSSKGYISWRICLYEHFVRAGEVLIAKQLGQDERAQKLIDDNVQGGFRYLPQIVEKLTIYNEHKDLYKSYDSYIIKVIENLKPVQN